MRTAALASYGLLGFEDGPLRTRRTFESIADLFRVKLEFCDRAPKRIAVHAQLPRRLALVPPVIRQHLKYEAPLKLTHSLFVVNTAGMHLSHKTIQLTFHRSLFLSYPLDRRVCVEWYQQERLAGTSLWCR